MKERLALRVLCTSCSLCLLEVSLSLLLVGVESCGLLAVIGGFIVANIAWEVEIVVDKLYHKIVSVHV